eukprot:3934408-Rhodomonas_salina.2
MASCSDTPSTGRIRTASVLPPITTPASSLVAGFAIGYTTCGSPTHMTRARASASRFPVRGFSCVLTA